MAKKMLIDATHAEETRVVVVDGNKVEEFDFESENKRQLAGNIYLAKVTRVEPSLQAAFIDYGGNRHGFLAFSEVHPDYYQIPVADREALMAEERAYAKQQAEDEEEKRNRADKPKRGRGRGRSKAASTETADAVVTKESDISGMDVVDFQAEAEDGDARVDTVEGTVPAVAVADTPQDAPASVETPDATDATEALTDEVPDEDAPKAADATEKDDSIESVADEDVSEEIRPPRKQRPKKYKIQEVIKVRQILLVQVVKEERGNKGAALTTYLSLAGRYCVLMPNTARGGGISRKITNAPDRKKLKEIANQIEVPEGAGLIIRTAGAQRTKTEINRDYEYLQRMWEQIRELTLKSTAPAKIYEEGNLIKRSIRDLYNKEIDEVFVEGDAGYAVAKEFMKMIMPSHAKNVKLYKEPLPLFARYQVEAYLGSMFNPTVQLKSGGYIVIGVTEALVAIDVNSGRATKENSIEDTALKTNLEASDEVARQLRLRDLAGLIVIDYIDMDERRNNTAVEKRFKDRLKSDRARIQVGRISGFGLLEMSRQRLRPGMIEATTQPCAHCHGTGLIRSDDNLSLSILRQLEEEGVRRRSREVLVKAPVAIANYLVNQKREHIAGIEAVYGMSVRVEADPFLISPDFSIEKFKTATRVVAEVTTPVVSVDASLMADIDGAEGVEDAEVVEAEANENAQNVQNTQDTEDGQAPKKRRRRRRRRRGRGGDDNQTQGENGAAIVMNGADTPVDAAADSTAPAQAEPAQAAASDTVEAVAEAEKPVKKVTRSRSRKPKAAVVVESTETPVEAQVATPVPAPAPAESEAPAKPKRRSRAKKVEAVAEPVADTPEVEAKEDSPKPAKKPARSRAKPKAKVEDAKPAAKAKPAKAKVAKAVPVETPEPVVTTTEPDKPKKRGWWSLGK
ncbi:MAG: Rne/Rng family ribonuclease [Paracoccaceae bacterium]